MLGRRLPCPLHMSATHVLCLLVSNWRLRQNMIGCSAQIATTKRARAEERESGGGESRESRGGGCKNGGGVNATHPNRGESMRHTELVVGNNLCNLVPFGVVVKLWKDQPQSCSQKLHRLAKTCTYTLSPSSRPFNPPLPPPLSLSFAAVYPHPCVPLSSQSRTIAFCQPMRASRALRERPPSV